MGQGRDQGKLFVKPIAVEVDDQGWIFVVETVRSRIQVYRKLTPSFLGRYDNARL